MDIPKNRALMYNKTCTYKGKQRKCLGRRMSIRDKEALGEAEKD